MEIFDCVGFEAAGHNGESTINTKAPLLWAALLSPKIYSRGAFCDGSWQSALQLALCRPFLGL